MDRKSFLYGFGVATLLMLIVGFLSIGAIKAQIRSEILGTVKEAATQSENVLKNTGKTVRTWKDTFMEGWNEAESTAVADSLGG